MRRNRSTPIHLLLSLVVAVSVWVPTTSRAQEAGDSALTLRDAVILALRHNPQLDVHTWDVRAAQGRVTQAGLRPNPELELEIEELRWSRGPDEIGTIGTERERTDGSDAGFGEGEYTISLSQVIELGGKRAKRIRLAEGEKAIVQWDYEAARADVLAEVATAFVDVLVAQEQLALTQDLLGLAENVARAFALRVEAGQVSPLESNRAEVARATAGTVVSQAERALSISRVRLAATWGDGEATFERAVGDLEEVESIAPLDELRSEIRTNPDLARWVAELTAREAELDLERAQRIPDPTLMLGFRATGLRGHDVTRTDLGPGGGITSGRTGFDSDYENSLVFGLSIPIPIFNRNQGNIAAASALGKRSSAQRRATDTSVHAALAEAHEISAGALVQLETIRTQVLPLARETFEKIQSGYDQGKFGYLDVLGAQRAFFDARQIYLDSLRRYHLGRITLDRLTGRALVEWSATVPQDNQESNHDE
jgi:outer membrane protein, heavy metal efflux system